MEMKYETRFKCGPEDLWPWIHEPEKQKQWMKGLVSNEKTSHGKEGVGSTFRMVIREGRRETTYDGTITAFDPPHSLHIELTGGFIKPEHPMAIRYDLEDQMGSTLLRYGAALEVKGFLRVMSPIFKVFGKMQLKSFLKKLRKLVEKPAETAG